MDMVFHWFSEGWKGSNFKRTKICSPLRCSQASRALPPAPCMWWTPRCPVKSLRNVWDGTPLTRLTQWWSTGDFIAWTPINPKGLFAGHDLIFSILSSGLFPVVLLTWQGSNTAVVMPAASCSTGHSPWKTERLHSRRWPRIAAK